MLKKPINYEDLRKEFVNPTFRKKMEEQLGNICVNCGNENNIQYHHIVPLENGGTNNLGNIVPLCEKCHYLAHSREFRDFSNCGRKPIITYAEAEKHLDKYFSLSIGTKECKELLGIAQGNKST